ncbi:MAG: hypothetical protein JRN10_01770 [Nitrososphaerota archaeon]|jgi:uncharacterized membrane protein required for colicin V production|nr:hypothetical protein [Nitrososphaerota archaeon]MDG6926917.1 hypothetical protein [Nitrososphaerota archaeon]MDG6929965.1 hypothetical protein [Nitrososphaerota archaeon]MDG6931916.1 hypothetical protein [Nitrososphaerota archaeon]MDG6943881.1 hypothetical protein [Nitrososphaerota archaeon]
MDPKDVILKIASLAAIVLAVYIALLGVHQAAPLITGIYYLMSAIIIIGALVAIFAKVE